uniref:PDZ domain-containing protein n=1 Tax=Electrophorus electricus TaxID=8005 RepID=A0A4W4EUV1_ELEEL
MKDREHVLEIIWNPQVTVTHAGRMETPQGSGPWGYRTNGPPFQSGGRFNQVSIVTVIVNQTHDGLLGFSVRGGVEHGLNIFISKVEPHSPAGRAGLCMGDKLLEVNGVSLENISINSAVRVLTGHRRLRLVLQRVGWVPGVRLGNEKTTWVDLIHQRLVVEEGGMSRSGGCSDATVCRSVPLQTSLSQPCLGLNIRGGIEYGLGIYVSGVDPGGLAEQGGIKTGDQILSANGVSLEHVTHSRAVGVLKSQSYVTLVIKETGRYPAYQEIVDKHSWLDKSNAHTSGTYHSLSRGSDSSCGSSLSSGTPLSSVTGVSQATLPVCLPFGAQLSGVSSFTAGLSCGPTELLHDSAIRAKEGRERRKTDVPMALSRPRAPLFRTQSHMTVSGEVAFGERHFLQCSTNEMMKQMERREGYKNVLNHWKTFFGLPWTRDSSKSPTGSPTRSPTRSPTGSPTGSSTGSSIRSPTGSPTRSPTGSSTGSSTGSPTRSPRNSELGTGNTLY